MDPKTRVLAIAGSLGLLVFIVELVRRRRLKEEYSVLWTLTAVTLLIMSLWFGLLLKLTHAIGAVQPASTLFFVALIFVVLMLLHFSVRISHLERNHTALVQELGLATMERDRLQDELDAARQPPEPSAREPHAAAHHGALQQGLDA
jgi:hypothetical protein